MSGELKALASALTEESYDTDPSFYKKFAYCADTGRIVSFVVQPSEWTILMENSELRKNRDIIMDVGKTSEGGSWGRWESRIPDAGFQRALDSGYELKHPDTDTRDKELRRFFKTDYGRACLV